MGTIILNNESPEIRHLCMRDKRLAKAINLVGPICYTPYEDPFSFLVHEIIEQMLSKKAGAQIYTRLEALCEYNVLPETVAAFSPEEIKQCGTSLPKAKYIINLANSVLDGSCDFDELSKMNDQNAIRYLLQLKGVGMWTAKMYLIFVLNRNNILPFEDIAFQQSFKWLYKTDDTSEESICKRCKKWSPYASIGARYMYRLLDGGFTKEPFHLYK